MNIPSIDLKFGPFCNECRRCEVKVIDSERVYSDGNEIYIYPPTITCENIHICRALYDRICKKEENVNAEAKNEAMKAAAAEFGKGLIRRRNEKRRAGNE